MSKEKFTLAEMFQMSPLANLLKNRTMTEILDEILKEHSVEDIVDYLRLKIDQGDIQSNVLIDYWSIEDVQSRHSPLTDEECRKILRLMRRRMDANDGINWAHIDDCIKEYKRQQESDKAFKG